MSMKFDACQKGRRGQTHQSKIQIAVSHVTVEPPNVAQ